MSTPVHKRTLIGRTYLHVQRVREIARVLFKYGYDDLISHLRLAEFIDSKIKGLTARDTSIEKLPQAVRLRLACEELGPTFVKMGQILSLRPDLLPEPYLIELEKLQDQVSPMSFEAVKAELERELKQPVDQIFVRVDETPLAAASIAQVHRARLRNGDEVVVKVQWPGLRSTIEVDLEILLYLAGLSEKHIEGWSVHHPVSVIEQLGRSLMQEIDFKLEASHMERFARQFEGEPGIVTPKVYRDYTTERVLTMEYVAGVKSSDIESLRVGGYDCAFLATRITDLILKQFFLHGFFHADPHPGNVYIMPNLSICFFDFGFMGHLNERARSHFADLVWGISERDETAVSTALLKISIGHTEPSRLALETEISEFIHQHFYLPLKEMEFGRFISQLMQITSRHGLSIPPNYFIMLKALGLMEALVRQLNPEHDIIAQAGPFLAQIRANRFKAVRVSKGLLEFGLDFAEMARQVPSELRKILSQLKTGEARIVFKHEGLEPLDTVLDRASNRLSFAVVLAALIIGSSIMVHANIPPRLFGVPVIGWGGFVIAALMGFRLLIAILRGGRM